MKNLKRQFLVVAALGWSMGCASTGPPLPPSLELPKAPSDLRATRKADRVTLTWSIPAQTTDRQSVRYLGKTLVCRSLATEIKQCDTPVGEAEPPAGFAPAKKSTPKKMSGSFTEILPTAMEREQPTGFATYAVEVLNRAGRGAGISNQVHMALVPTLPPFGGFNARTTSPGVLISWECPRGSGNTQGETKYIFHIYRREEGKTGEARIAQVDATSCAAGSDNEKSTSFLDQHFEWENTYFYRGTVVSTLEVSGKAPVEVEGEDTAEVKVFAHDVFPPVVPTGLQAVFSGPGPRGFVDLIWSPVTDADLEGYIVHRREEGTAAVKVNAELVKTPAFRDAQVVAGSAVDERGNESARSEEASERVP